MRPLPLALISVAWFAWAFPFFLTRRSQSSRTTPRERPTLDRRARWGILIEGVAFALIWQTRFWERPPSAIRIGVGAGFLGLAVLLSWTSAIVLGRQWRFDAGLNADHQLITAGAYRVVRHPIYTSMLCLLLGMGSMVTPLPLLGLAAIVFMIGTEIRVRIEDQLLASRFGEEFRAYQRRVAAYLPFLW